MVSLNAHIFETEILISEMIEITNSLTDDIPK